MFVFYSMSILKDLHDQVVLPPEIYGSLIDIQQDPSNWQDRKKLAEHLYDDGHPSQAAEVILDAPEIPFQSVDVLFVVRILGDAQRDRAIEFIDHVLKRVAGDKDACMKLAQVFCGSGHHLLSSRFYGAAQAAAPENFDIGTETASLWLDDRGVFIDFWGQLDYKPSPPKQMPMEDFLGKEMSFLEYTTRITAKAMPQVQAPPKIPQAQGDRPKLLIPKAGI